MIYKFTNRRRLLALLLAASLMFALFAGCATKEDAVADPTAAPDSTEIPAETVTWVDDPEQYTYRTAISSDASITWNPHQWETSLDNSLMGYTQSALYAIEFKDSTYSGTTFMPEMAVGLPTDVTASLTAEQKETYNVPADATEGYAWQIKLIDYAVWQDGTPITAQDYIDYYELLLDGKYLNYRASDEFSGETILANAKGYYDVGAYGVGSVAYAQAGADTDVSAGNVAISMTQAVAWVGASLAEGREYGYDPYFTAADGVNYVEKWENFIAENGGENEEGYFILNAEQLAEFEVDFTAVCDYNGGGYEGEWKEFAFTYSVVEDVPFSSVGIFKDDDYTFTMVFALPQTEYNIKLHGTSIVPINKSVYLANTTETDTGLKQTSYGTGSGDEATLAETYLSCGPYIMSAREVGKSITFTRNPNWYGYHDDKHIGQYTTDTIVLSVIEKQETQLLEFLAGNLDDVSLTSTDVATYRGSSQLQRTPEEYTYCFFINTDSAKLAELEAANNGSNLQVLTNQNFRKAIMFAIDRQQYCDNTAGQTPAFAYMNQEYTYDMEREMETGERLRYRDLDVAKEAIVTAFGMEYGSGKDYATLDDAYDAVTGKDVKYAKELLDLAYDELVAENPGFDPSKPIAINIPVAAAISDPSIETRFTNISANLQEAFVGTKFEGMTITLTPTESPARYDEICNEGAHAAILGAWGGARMRPFYMLSCYMEPGTNVAYGSTPTEDLLTLNIPEVEGLDPSLAGEITMTVWEWQQANNDGIYMDAPFEIRTMIIAAEEQYLLDQAVNIPISISNVVSLVSYKYETPVKVYDAYGGWGSIRDYTYNYSDAAWAEFIASNDLAEAYK